jgi:hypothetical protein
MKTVTLHCRTQPGHHERSTIRTTRPRTKKRGAERNRDIRRTSEGDKEVARRTKGRAL